MSSSECTPTHDREVLKGARCLQSLLRRAMLHDCCAGSEGRDGLLRRATGSLGALLQLVMRAPKHEGDADKARWGPRIRRPSHVDLARLDSCTCGPHGCAIVLLSSEAKQGPSVQLQCKRGAQVHASGIVSRWWQLHTTVLAWPCLHTAALAYGSSSRVVSTT